MCQLEANRNLLVSYHVVNWIVIRSSKPTLNPQNRGSEKKRKYFSQAVGDRRKLSNECVYEQTMSDCVCNTGMMNDLKTFSKSSTNRQLQIEHSVWSSIGIAIVLIDHSHLRFIAGFRLTFRNAMRLRCTPEIAVKIAFKVMFRF